MTQQRQGTATQAGTSAAPVAPGPEALEPFANARPWVLLFTVLLYGYAAVGGAVGVAWGVVLAVRLVTGPAPTRPFITVWSINLLFAPIAFVGAVLATGYFRAAGRASLRRNPDDLERASIALKRLWLWAGVMMIVLIAFTAAMVVAAVLTGEWPG